MQGYPNGRRPKVSQAITLTTIIPAQELKTISQEHDFSQSKIREGDEPSRKFLKLLEEKKRGAEQDHDKVQPSGRLDREQNAEKNTLAAARKKDVPVENLHEDKSREMSRNVRALVERTGTLQKDLKELKLQLKKVLEEPKRTPEQVRKTPYIQVSTMMQNQTDQGAKKITQSANDKNLHETRKIGSLKDGKERVETAAKPKAVIIDLRDTVKTQVDSKNTSGKKEVVYKNNSARPVDEITKADGQESGTIRYFSKAGMLAESQAANISHDENHADFSQTVKDPVSLPRLAETLKNEMVKHTGIILKNNGEGEINLVLKPESLGSVRVKLSLEDNNIVGRIFVENNTVKQILESNLDDLSNSFYNQGFGKSVIDVFVQGEGSQNQNAGEDKDNVLKFANSRTEYLDPAFSCQEIAPDYEYVNIVL
ncbi:MAG: flagellar hook-length control protein FliK [Spirochaetaceae bacterium]|nr:MAG: flagellar hook-length control protein FliK [Spirochaetaceae bacterium]